MNPDSAALKDRRAGAAFFIAGLGVCLGAGFVIGRLQAPRTSSTLLSRSEGALVSGNRGVPPQTGTPQTPAGSLIAEWEQFRGPTQKAAAAFPALYTAVLDIKDSFRRRAFRAALCAEWAATDPLGGIAFLRQEHPVSAGEVLREWMRLDPNGSITQMLSGGENNVAMLLNLMEEIARLAPARLVEVANRSRASLRNQSTTAEDAFAIFARSDRDAARTAAESITGPLRVTALGGVAKAWAESDPASALAWAQVMPKGETRDTALRAVLTSWAKRDPFSALDQIDLVPAARSDNRYDSDTGAEVLSEAARKDWDATMRWLGEHPGKLGPMSTQGLAVAVSQRLNIDPIATLEALERSNLPDVGNLLANGLGNASSAKCDAMWDWIDRQPASSFTKSAREALLNVIAYKDPEAALTRLEEIAESSENRELLEAGVRSLVNGRASMTRFEDLLAKASPKVRPYLLETGFSYATQNHGGIDPQRWLSRLQELPAEQRANAAVGLAGNWAATDPESATKWAISLEEPGQRTGAIASAVSTWIATDQREAAEWINLLPPGADRDVAAVSLVAAISRSDPEAAWTWALSVQDPQQRQQARQQAFMMLQQKDPNRALQLMQGADLSPSETTVQQ